MQPAKIRELARPIRQHELYGMDGRSGGILGRSKATILKLKKADQLPPAIKNGRHVMFHCEDIADLLEAWRDCRTWCHVEQTRGSAKLNSNHGFPRSNLMPDKPITEMSDSDIVKGMLTGQLRLLHKKVA